MPRYSVETIEAMQKHLLGYRDNLRVEVAPGIPIVARTVAELRTLSTWPGQLVLDVHIDLDPGFSVMTVRRTPLEVLQDLGFWTLARASPPTPTSAFGANGVRTIHCAASSHLKPNSSAGTMSTTKR